MAKKPNKAEKGLEDFGEDEVAAAPAAEQEAPAQPKIKKKEKKSHAKAEDGVQPRKAYVLGPKGEPEKDEDGEPEEYAPGFIKQVGYVNQNGVLFPVGFKFRGGLVGWRGNVVLNRCPKCGNKQMTDEAVLGICANQKVPPLGEPCGYSAIAELEDYILEE